MTPLFDLPEVPTRDARALSQRTGANARVEACLGNLPADPAPQVTLTPQQLARSHGLEARNGTHFLIGNNATLNRHEFGTVAFARADGSRQETKPEVRCSLDQLKERLGDSVSR